MGNTVEIARRGQITIPKSLRDKLGIEEGQKYGLRTIEGGLIILTPQAERSTIALGQLREALLNKGASLDAMLADLRRKREAGDE